MDHQYIQDNQLVERYLQDKLSDEEKVAFEEYYLSNAETLAELELAEKMQDGFRVLEESEFFDKAAIGGWFNRVFLSPQYAAAASVLLVFSLGFSGILYRQMQSDDTIYGTQIVPIVSTRGSATSQAPTVIKVKQPGDWVVLLVDPGMESYLRYRANVDRIDSGASTAIWQLDDLQPGYEEMLAVGLPSTLLEPGDYEIRLSGRADSDDFAEIRRFNFTVSQP